MVGFVVGGGLELAQGAQHDVELLDDMYGQADGARLVHDGALDVLPHPPGGVGGKPEAALGIELLERMDQAEVAFLDQVVERNAAMLVMLGDADHQPQVGLDHALARREIPGARCARQRQLLGRRQQRAGADLVQIDLREVFDEVDFATGAVRLLGKVFFGRFEEAFLVH